MKSAMLGLLAETPIHPGTGRGMGVIDLPVAREASTDYPVLVGSSLKGALRDKAQGIKATNENSGQRFGCPDQAGDLLISDGRLLLLPVRSLTSSFRWVTCPHLIERYRRDCARAGLSARPEVPSVKPRQVLAVGTGDLFLEERQFSIYECEAVSHLADAMADLVLHKETQDRLASQLAILDDDDFAWFVRYGLSIQARNFLNDSTKQSKNLWYEETLPPDTIMYAVVMGRSNEAIHTLDSLFPESDPYLQAGGNETVGQGWFAVQVCRTETGGSAK